MTEMVNNENVGSESSVPSAPTQNHAPAQQERVYTSSEVTDIVKRNRNEAVDRYQRLQKEQPDYFREKYGDSALPQAPQSTLTEDRIKQLASEQLKKDRDEWLRASEQKHMEDNATRIAKDFKQRLEAGKSKYSDYDKNVINSIRFERFPNTVQLSTMVDNTEDIWHELAQPGNRSKMAMLEQLANSSPEDALEELRYLSQSIKDNQRGARVQIPNEPLHQIRPSNTGTDNGIMTPGDYKNRYRNLK